MRLTQFLILLKHSFLRVISKYSFCKHLPARALYLNNLLHTSFKKDVTLSMKNPPSESRQKTLVHTVSITTDTGKTAVLTHSHTLSEFITSNLNRKYQGLV